MYRPLFCLVFALLPCACVDEPPPAQLHYTEVADAAGLDFEHYNGAQGEYYYPETMGAGAAFFDYDDDGWQDIYLVNGTYLTGLLPDPLPANRLYRNTGEGTFVDVTERAGTATYSASAPSRAMP